MLAVWACTVPAPVVGDLSREERAAYARASLERARELRARGELTRAERLLRSVIAVAPDERRAHALHAELLEEMGRPQDAARARRAARALETSPVPNGPGELASRDLLVTIAGEELGDEAFTSALAEPMALALAERVEDRLPEARIVRRVPSSVEEGRDWLVRIQPRAVLALRIARGYCRESLRDGAFAVAELEVVTATAGADELDRLSLTERLFDPRRGACLEQVTALAFEQVLEEPLVRRALATEVDGDGQHWPAGVVRGVFPTLDAAIVARTSQGREAMERGRFSEAQQRLREAADLDPEDPFVQELLREVEASVAMQREIRATNGGFVADTAAEAAASLAEGD